MNVFYSYSKTDLKLQCDYCIKFQLFEGAQHVYSRLKAVCCMLLPHNPYRLPQHYKRHVCGSSCSCKLQFLSISIVWSIRLQYANDNLSGQQFLLSWFQTFAVFWVLCVIFWVFNQTPGKYPKDYTQQFLFFS